MEEEESDKHDRLKGEGEMNINYRDLLCNQ